MTAAPIFSVVICNYNYAGFVGGAIRSALQQTFPADRYEVVVVDDGSTDGSLQVIEAFRDDPRVRVVAQPNRGQGAAFEAGVREARGDYVCLLDSDDGFAPNKLERVAQRIAEIGDGAGELFLCHDLWIEDATRGDRIATTWFDVMKVKALGDRYSLDQPGPRWPFAIPCGEVFSRGLARACLEALPMWAYRWGADGILCQAALVRTGTIHYLQEPLGTYRIHGGNNLAFVREGRYGARPDWRARIPLNLQALERWVDTLELTAAQRATRFAYLRRVEHMARVPSLTHALEAPAVAVIVLGTGDPAATRASAESALLQSYAKVETWIPESDGPAGPAPDGVAAPRAYADDRRASEIARLARAYRVADGELVLFLRAGDRLDRECVERHVFQHQHGALAGLSCTDVRLASASAALIHSSVFANSGAWPEPIQRVPALATRLGAWVGAPVSACMFRRSALLDGLFARERDMPEALQRAGFWLAFQVQHHTLGALRLREPVVTLTLADGAAANYGHLAAPLSLAGESIAPPVHAAALWLGKLYRQEQALFRRWLPPVWHERFGQWLAASSK